MKHVIKTLPIGNMEKFPFIVDEMQSIHPYKELNKDIYSSCNVRLYLDFESKIRLIAKMGGKKYENRMDKMLNLVDSTASGLWNLIYQIAFEGKEMLIASNKDLVLTLAHSLFIKSKSLAGKKKLVQAFDGACSYFKYSSLAEYNFNQARAQLKLVKNLEKFCKIVIIEGDEVYAKVSLEDKDILTKVVNDLYSDIKFYVRWLN